MRIKNLVVLGLALNVALLPKLSRADDDVTPLSACGQVDPHSHKQEIKCPLSAFQGRKPVDILWVVDNSGSMSSSQQNLISNTSAFINQLVVGNAPKWKLGLISTDTTNAPFIGFTPSTALNYQTPNAPGLFQAAVALLGTKYISELGGWCLSRAGDSYGTWKCDRLPFGAGSVVEFELDAAAKTVHVVCGRECGVGHIAALTDGEELYPAISLYYSGQKVALL